MIAPPSDGWAGRFAGLPVLQQVAARIPAMPAALTRMGQAVLAHPFRAATLNIDEFAGEVSVSIATRQPLRAGAGLCRLPAIPRRAGARLRGHPRAGREPAQQPAAATGTQQAMVASLRETLANLEHTLQALQHQPCEQAVSLIAEADRC
jgi:DNA-binding MurR/RpiR family transcriptional regulator